MQRTSISSDEIVGLGNAIRGLREAIADSELLLGREALRNVVEPLETLERGFHPIAQRESSTPLDSHSVHNHEMRDLRDAIGRLPRLRADAPTAPKPLAPLPVAQAAETVRAAFAPLQQRDDEAHEQQRIALQQVAKRLGFRTTWSINEIGPDRLLEHSGLHGSVLRYEGWSGARETPIPQGVAGEPTWLDLWRLADQTIPEGDDHLFLEGFREDGPSIRLVMGS